MDIQKYKAKLKGTDTEVIGYITETRDYVGQGSYSGGISYVISVTEISMPGGLYGTYMVEKETIEKV